MALVPVHLHHSLPPPIMLSRTLRGGFSSMRVSSLHTARRHLTQAANPDPNRASASRLRYVAGGLAGLALYFAGAFYPPEALRLLYPISTLR